MAFRYKQNYEAFGRLVERSQAMKDAMTSRAEKVKPRFEETAPIGEPYEPDDHAGRYAGSARIETGTKTVEVGERAYAAVIVDDPAAMSIEFGHYPVKKNGERGARIEGTHTLTRALDAIGE